MNRRIINTLLLIYSSVFFPVYNVLPYLRPSGKLQCMWTKSSNPPSSEQLKTFISRVISMKIKHASSCSTNSLTPETNMYITCKIDVMLVLIDDARCVFTFIGHAVSFHTCNNQRWNPGYSREEWYKKILEDHYLYLDPIFPSICGSDMPCTSSPATVRSALVEEWRLSLKLRMGNFVECFQNFWLF